jgi:hypothetical protein
MVASSVVVVSFLTTAVLLVSCTVWSTCILGTKKIKGCLKAQYFYSFGAILWYLKIL